LIVLSYLIFFKKDIVVILVNDSYLEITEIRVIHSAGSIEVPFLRPMSSEKVYIEPAGESALSIKFRDPSTKEIREEKLDTYFEHGYAGTIEFFYWKSGEVTWRNDVRLSFWATVF
jgi:hypothetical protein